MTFYKLAINGDDLERHYWGLFLKDYFPSYESFWLKFVVPLTNRPIDIHFKNDLELSRIGKTEADICIAQLSYSIFRHLMRCFKIREEIKTSPLMSQFDLMLEGMTRLVGSLDICFELFERLKNPKEYNAFDEKSGRRISDKRRDLKSDPARSMRIYRNNLVHGRMPPLITWEEKLCLPAIKKETEYFDWRKVTNSSEPLREEYKKDFFSAAKIFEEAWSNTINYLENQFKTL